MKIKNAFAITGISALIGAGIGCENVTDPNKKSSYESQEKKALQSPAIIEPRKTLEEHAIDDVVKRSGKGKEALSAKFVTYGTETHPLCGGYVHGSYLAVKDAKEGELFVFSQGGRYLGMASPLSFRSDSRRGEGNVWKSKEAGSDTECVFVWNQSAASPLYFETPMENGLVERIWGSEGPNPVYRILGNRLIKEKEPYIGTFGGDGRHYIDDRGQGKFFVVKSEIRDQNGAAAEEYGEFFEVKKEEYDSIMLKMKKQNGKLELIIDDYEKPFDIPLQDYQKQIESQFLRLVPAPLRK